MPLSGVTNYPEGVLPGLSSHRHIFSILPLHPREESGQNPLHQFFLLSSPQKGKRKLKILANIGFIDVLNNI